MNIDIEYILAFIALLPIIYFVIFQTISFHLYHDSIRRKYEDSQNAQKYPTNK